MTRKETLEELIAKIEAGDCTAEIYGLTDDCLDVESRTLVPMSYNGSLDAAKALHEAVLPGWWWTVGTCQVSDDARVSPEGEASVMSDGREWSDVTDIDQRPPGNPARAWLLSILKALHSMEPDQTPKPDGLNQARKASAMALK